MSSIPAIDPSSDKNGTVLSQLARRYDFPEFVKAADVETTLRPEDTPSSSYAWPQRKMFPCHSSAATWLSAAYFHEKLSSFRPTDRQQIESRLEHFSNYFGIRPAYDALKAEAAEKTAAVELPEDHYAYVVTDENGCKECFFPLTDGNQVKAAVEWLEANRDTIPYTHRNEIGCRILNRVQRLGTKLASEQMEFLERQGGAGLPNRDELLQAIEIRSKLAKTEEQSEEIKKLASVVRATPQIAVQQPDLVKLAETLDIIDTALNLQGKYTDMIKRPEDVVFAVTHSKVAATRNSLVPLQNGSVYSRDQIEKLSYSDLCEVLGDDFAAEVSTGLRVDADKLAEIAATLPRTDAQLLDTLLKSAGETPRAFANTQYTL